MTTQYAKQHSLDAILITSGVESLENSIRQALQLHQLMTAVRVRDALLERQARQHQWELAVLQEDQTVFWESPSLARKPRLRKMMQKIAARADAAEGGVQIRRIQEQPWKISCQRVFLEGSPYFFLQAEPLPEDMTRSDVVSFFSCEDISPQYFKKYINSALHQNLQRYAASHSPVLILGEISTHKDRAANVLYTNGLHRDHPLCVVDCDRADSRFWHTIPAAPSILRTATASLGSRRILWLGIFYREGTTVFCFRSSQTLLKRRTVPSVGSCASSAPV